MPNVLTRLPPEPDYSGLTRAQLIDIIGSGSGAATAEARRRDRRLAEQQLSERFPVQVRETNGVSRGGVASSIAPAAVLNTQSTIAELQRNFTAAGTPIPIVYGHAQVGGKPFTADYTDGLWTVGYTVALGEINAFRGVWINGEAPAAGTTINYYTGTPTQTADPLLAAVVDGYADTLVIPKPSGNIGIAYVVLQFSSDVYSDWPQVVVEVEGRKVFNPETGLVEYSANPALHLGDFLSSSVYGHGYTVDAASLLGAQQACDDTSSGEVRRKSFLVIDQIKTTDAWVEILANYASVFTARRGRTVHLVPDRPAASVMSFTADDIVRGSLQIQKQDSSNLPTVVRIQYTDKTDPVWRNRWCEPALAPGVALGTTPRRESLVNMSGIGRHSQAHRDSVERLNKLKLSDLSVRFLGYDACMQLEIGDVITLTHPYGLTGKLLRLDRDPVQVSPGRWSISAQEYDPGAYSDEIATQPSYTDGNLPSDAPPEAPQGLMVGETTYQIQNGEFVSRLDITWAPSTNIFVTGYTVVVKDQASTVVFTTNTPGAATATPPLLEQVQYTVEVYAVTPLRMSESPATQSFTIIGKTAIPDPPAELTGFEAGGEVRLRWPASTDVDAQRYEIRYGPTTGSWETAEALDIVDGLRLISKDVPPSENQPGAVWRFYVKTIDSIRQRSTTAASVDISVTQDNDAFTAGTVSPITATGSSASLHETVEDPTNGKTQLYSDGGQTWADLFGSAPMSSFTEPLVSYQLVSSNEWISEELALLTDRAGNWVAEAPSVVEYYGTVFPAMGLSSDGVSYLYTSLSRRGSFRYAHVRLFMEGVFKIELPGGFIRADVIAVEEVGSDVSLASGGKTITLSNQYAETRSIVITPEGTASRTAVINNVIVGGGASSFDVYIFDANDNQVPTPFRWTYKGV